MKKVLISIVLALGIGLTQARERTPENAGGKSASETTKKEFTFISPGEGRYHFMINEAFSDENNVMFKWSPKTAGTVLVIKTDDKVLDEIAVKNTDHIRLNLSKYSSYRTLTWYLTVSESEEVLKGIIDLRKYLPPFVMYAD